MSGEPLDAILDAYFAGLDAEDWAGIEALFADDAELLAPGAHRRGAPAVARYFRDALAPYPDHHDQPTRRVLAGGTATVEIHFSGRMPNGAAMEFDAVDVFDVRDGRIVRLTSWYDSAEVRRALLRGQAQGDGDDAAAAALALACRSLRGRPPAALGGVWHGDPPAVLCLPATVIEASSGPPGGDLRGRALLVRGGAGELRLPAGAAAIATDGEAPVGEAPLLGTGFDLAALAPGDGLLVSVADSDGRAHAALLR
jgi:ketosteroid isomerase-like protein